jgi:hypothetical protein
MTFRGRAFVFINYRQALKFGHVGWGFATGADEFLYGSADHLLKRPYHDLIALARYSYVPAGGEIDFWTARGSYDTMIDDMTRGHHICYHAVKEIAVSEPKVKLAENLVERISGGGWCVVGNNCVNQAATILRAYGASPDKLPEAVILPRLWFKAIRGEECTIRAAAPLSDSTKYGMKVR